MDESIWETFDALFRTAQQQAKRIEDLETRITTLERQLREMPVETSRPLLRVVETEEVEGVPA